MSGALSAALTAALTCDKCGNAYSSKDSLRFHRRARHGKAKTGATHLCRLCPERFTTQRGLSNHEKWHARKLTSFVEKATGLEALATTATLLDGM